MRNASNNCKSWIIGTTHGDLTTLINELNYHKILTGLTTEDQKILQRIYHTDESTLTTEDLQQWTAIVNQLRVTPCQLTLLDSAIRKTDASAFFALTLIKKIHQSLGHLFELILSPADINFLRDYSDFNHHTNSSTSANTNAPKLFHHTCWHSETATASSDMRLDTLIDAYCNSLVPYSYLLNTSPSESQQQLHHIVQLIGMQFRQQLKSNLTTLLKSYQNPKTYQHNVLFVNLEYAKTRALYRFTDQTQPPAEFIPWTTDTQHISSPSYLISHGPLDKTMLTNLIKEYSPKLANTLDLNTIHTECIFTTALPTPVSCIRLDGCKSLHIKSKSEAMMAHYAKFNTSPTHNTLYVLRSMMRQAEVDVSSRKKKRYIAHQIGLLTCTINSHNPPRVSVMKLLLKQCTNILKIRTGLKKSKTFTKYQDLLQSITQACEHLDQLFVNDPTPVIKANCTELIDRSLTLFKQQIPYLGEATPKTCAIQQTQEQLTRLRKKSQDQPQDNSIISEVKHTLQEGKKEFDRHRFLPSKMASTLIRCHRTQAHKITHADITDLITKVDDLNTQRPHATY